MKILALAYKTFSYYFLDGSSKESLESFNDSSSEFNVDIPTLEESYGEESDKSDKMNNMKEI